MRHSRNIYLIGPMGAGKTTVGRMLAKALGIIFVDSDREIEQRTGVSIPMIFEYEGEGGFRKREAEVLADLVQSDDVVLATGGGAVLQEANRQLLKQHGFVVYLQCSVDTQLERTHKDANRPLLRTENPRQRLTDLSKTREPLYREIADTIVDTGRYSSRSVVRHILRAYQRTMPLKSEA